jgi:pimeloyl-ACP methyl ester carboxylesterase
MIMGTPPLTIPPRLDQAFLLNPALEFAFRADLSGEEISKLAASFISRDDANFKHVMDSIQQADPLVRPFIGQSIAMDLKDDEALILKEAKFPVAIVHGMNDPLVNTDYINQLNIKLWRDKIQVIEDASHSPFLENPLAFNKILKEFIDEN